MPRGRKKDMTIPQTRALTTQRAYRARKAQYLNELEERCRIAEDENTRLRTELAAARADAETSATARERHTAEAAQDLMQSLAVAQRALSHFQSVAFPRGFFPLYDLGPSNADDAPSSASPQASTNSTSSSTSQVHYNHHHSQPHSQRPRHPTPPPPHQTWRHHSFSGTSTHAQSLPPPSGSRAPRLSIASLIEPLTHDEHRRHSHSGNRSVHVASEPAACQPSIIHDEGSRTSYPHGTNGDLMESSVDDDSEEEDQLYDGSAEPHSNSEEYGDEHVAHTHLPLR